MPRSLRFTWERNEDSGYTLTFPKNGYRRGANATEAALIEEIERHHAILRDAEHMGPEARAFVQRSVAAWESLPPEAKRIPAGAR